MPRLSLLTALVLGFVLSLSSAYVPQQARHQQQQQQHQQQGFSFEVASQHAGRVVSSSWGGPAAFVASASAFVVANAPLVAQAAVEVDGEYEYGAVDAPIGLAVGGGILAILTALLPVALRGGEEAFEEIKDREAGTFGKKDNKDVLKGRK